MDGDIPPQLIGELVDAIADAYRQKVQFDQLLRRELDKNPRAVAPISSDDMMAVADAAVDNAGAEGWLHDLILRQNLEIRASKLFMRNTKHSPRDSRLIICQMLLQVYLIRQQHLLL